MLTQLLPSRFQAHEEAGQRGRCRLSDQELEHQQNDSKKMFSTIFKTTQSSYLSKISQIIFVEKELSCGEILGNFEKFWEILRNFRKFGEILPQFTRFHVEKN